MAQKTVVTVVCDLPHDGAEVTSEGTIKFSFNGVDYRIDACGPDAAKLRAEFSVYIKHACKVPKSKAKHRQGSQLTQAEIDTRNADIRAWAKRTNKKINERGRIPGTIVAEYEDAHRPRTVTALPGVA